MLMSEFRSDGLSNFEERLDLRLEEAIKVSDAQDLIELAREISGEISDLEEKLKDNKTKLDHIVEKLNSVLGNEVRKRQPKMEVIHKGGNCTCGYRSNNICCRPNLVTGRWDISGKLGSPFVKNYPQMMRLSHDVEPLADAIASFFKRYYRTLS